MQITQVYNSKTETVLVAINNDEGTVEVHGTEKLYFDSGITASTEFVKDLIIEYYKKICNG